jgi:hypothetical protein
MNQYLREKLDPYIKLSPFLGIGLVVVAIAVAGIYHMQRGAHVELVGSILKVRTMPLDENSSAAVIDFRFRNPSDYPFVVRTVESTLTGADGKSYEGMVISEVDSASLFQASPAMGQKFNPSLILRTRIGPRTTMDRMLAVRFEVPEKALDERKNLRIRIVEVDGPVADLVEGQN